jgi:hypothetical protein
VVFTREARQKIAAPPSLDGQIWMKSRLVILRKREGRSKDDEAKAAVDQRR